MKSNSEVCTYNSVGVGVSVHGNLYLYKHTGDPGYSRPRTAANKCERSMQQDADPSTRPEQRADSSLTINRVSIRVLPF
jgi:hypothetical protein